MEVAGLDYKSMVQCFRPSYLPLESKTMVSKTLLLEIIKKNHEQSEFLFEDIKNT